VKINFDPNEHNLDLLVLALTKKHPLSAVKAFAALHLEPEEMGSPDIFVRFDSHQNLARKINRKLETNGFKIGLGMFPDDCCFITSLADNVFGPQTQVEIGYGPVDLALTVDNSPPWSGVSVVGAFGNVINTVFFFEGDDYPTGIYWRQFVPKTFPTASRIACDCLIHESGRCFPPEAIPFDGNGSLMKDSLTLHKGLADAFMDRFMWEIDASQERSERRRQVLLSKRPDPYQQSADWYEALSLGQMEGCINSSNGAR
jgi:hypothetical protein